MIRARRTQEGLGGGREKESLISMQFEKCYQFILFFVAVDMYSLYNLRLGYFSSPLSGFSLVFCP